MLEAAPSVFLRMLPEEKKKKIGGVGRGREEEVRQTGRAFRHHQVRLFKSCRGNWGSGMRTDSGTSVMSPSSFTKASPRLSPYPALGLSESPSPRRSDDGQVVSGNRWTNPQPPPTRAPTGREEAFQWERQGGRAQGRKASPGWEWKRQLRPGRAGSRGQPSRGGL